MAANFSDFSAASLRFLNPLECRPFTLSSPVIPNHISIAKAPSPKPSPPLHSNNKNRNGVYQNEARKCTLSQVHSSTSENLEESRLTEQVCRFMKYGNYKSALALVESMRADGYKPNKYLCSIILNELCKIPDPDSAACLFELLEAEGIQQQYMYDMLIRRLCAKGHLAMAFEALGRMRTQGFNLTSSSRNCIVKVLCAKKMLDAALAMVEHFRHFRTERGCGPNWVMYGYIIECAIVTRGLEEVPALLDQMTRDRLWHNNAKMEAMYFRVVKRLNYSGKAAVALEFIKLLPLNGPGPNYVTYNILIKQFLINGNRQDAQLVIDEMLMRLQKVDKIYFNLENIVRLLCANGLVRSARELMHVAVQKFRLDPDMSCYSLLIAAYIEDNRMDLVIELVDFMTSIQQFPNVDVYNTIITGLCKMGYAKEAIDVLENMSYFGVPPDQSTYNRIIGSLWRNGKKKMAVKMLERMQEEGLSHLQWSTYKTIMVSLSQEGKVDEVLELFQVMQANGIAADVNCYNALLLGYCNTGRMNEAMQLFEEMLQRGCELNWHTYGNILRVAVSAGHKAKVVDMINEIDEKEILSKSSMKLLKNDLLSDHRSADVLV